MKTISQLKEMKRQGQKITCLTAYDASFARLMEQCDIDALLVGDSLGMVIQGKATTLPVSVEEMEYHTSTVCRGAPNTFVIADMPFMSDLSYEEALHHAGQLIKTGAHCIKLEGAQAFTLEIIEGLSARGVPVCAHIGLQPQSVNKLGGYKVQGKTREQATQLIEHASALESAGADLMVLECVPATVAAEISRSISIPTIGIGAGVDCDGQVLVIYDVLGISPGKSPRFVRNFLAESDSIESAICTYRDAVKSKSFPTAEHSF
jgi:3-methyl-2-oxobutanoate hydroxymethyltransferase